MNLSVQPKETPLWCATADNHSRATFIVCMLWIVALALLASAFICPSSVAWRIGEGAIAAYLIFHLAPMTSHLWRSKS
jgi:hypothetical protein